MSDFPLSRLQSEFGHHLVDPNSGVDVFHTPNVHSLIQAAGYLKHIRAITNKKGVFFRGQTQLYSTLGPTLLRGVKSGVPSARRIKLLSDFLESIDSEKQALKAVNKTCREALLQHYGIRTTWIDVVDNIWVALWFACHKAKSVTIGNEEYLHFEKRIPGANGAVNSDFAYVLLLESAFFHPVEDQPGHYKDERSETIDLRIAAPSHFVRPHAQHGVLVRKLSRNGKPVGDCRDLHIGTIRVDLSAALDWLGSASTLTSHSLFPPAFYDYGYRELLRSVQPEGNSLGFIHRIQS